MTNNINSIIVQLICMLIIIGELRAANLSQMNKQKTSHHQPQTQPHHQHAQKQGQHNFPGLHSSITNQLQQTEEQHNQQQEQQQTQYVHDKDTIQEAIHSSEEDISDRYPFLNNEADMPSTNFNWNPFSIPAIASNPLSLPFSFEGFTHSTLTPKFLPIVGFPQPIFIPYPLYIAPDMYYPTFSGDSNDIDDMARARRPSSTSTSSSRNSPIYYVRMPPTPYMFVPSLSYSSTPHTPPTPPPTPPSSPSSQFQNNYSPPLLFQSIPSFQSYSPIFNLPINFLTNGKPSNIYQMSSINDIQFANPLNNYPIRPNPFRPASTITNYFPTHSSYLGTQQQDSKMTSLKRPFIFNGRPEDIYVLPNNFNPLYTEGGYF